MNTFQITMLGLFVVLVSSVAGYPVGHPCEDVLCQNNGTCEAWGVQGDFKCICPGFYGKFCQVVDPCACEPCKNGGQCEILGETFRCFCTSDYVGRTCSRVNPCVGKTCPSGQHCIPWGKTGYNCVTN